MYINHSQLEQTIFTHVLQPLRLLSSIRPCNNFSGFAVPRRSLATESCVIWCLSGHHLRMHALTVLMSLGQLNNPVRSWQGSDIVFDDASIICQCIHVVTISNCTYPPPQNWIVYVRVQWTVEVIKQLLTWITACTLRFNTSANGSLNERHSKAFWLDRRVYL